ncbi:SLC45 family MFS transporter [Lentilactobacillus sp. TOM.63]|uniref:SLC45 family MFS transporter n=1 Tax=Lentilactobacillus sp. TOM.63 TaxID=3055077 RepID=UPI0025A0AAC2|nr:SLC45 family MFS transporter [Lentilactobacillus sp. TOM.63]MDM7516457.1 SLC45 family MFS transporter [Lentilactobacillus sp. TOM.63]
MNQSTTHLAGGHSTATSVPKKSTNRIANSLPNLPMKTLFAITFGFCGVNMAFSLQSSQMSRIFQTIGADPTKLGLFFILPPLAGLIVQPLVGKYSDMIWTRFGRRMPYLLFAAPIAAIVMILLPNAGSFDFGYASLAALLFGAIAISLMDLSSNICMQPFRMIIGDMVNESQKDKAWSWQQAFSNLGGVLATILPFVLTYFGVANTAKRGVVPLSVRLASYIGAAILLGISAYTIHEVKEYDPETYALYHHIDPNTHKKSKPIWQLIKEAPKALWEVALVQMFAWIGIQYMWTYTTGAIAQNVWHTTNATSAGYQAAGNWYGILTFIQSMAAVLYGFLILSHTNPYKRKNWYRFGLLSFAIGLIWVFFIHNQYLLIVPFCLIGIGFFTVHVEPFNIFTSSLNGSNEGSYIGIFNGTICLPQILASVASFIVFQLVGKSMPGMMLIAGISMLIATIAISVIKQDAPQIDKV